MERECMPANEETWNENVREDSLMRRKNVLSSRIGIDRESERRDVSQKNLSFSSSSFHRLSTRIEVPRKTHLTFFVSKEIIQLVMQHWDRKSQNNGKSFSS